MEEMDYPRRIESSRVVAHVLYMYVGCRRSPALSFSVIVDSKVTCVWNVQMWYKETRKGR